MLADMKDNQPVIAEHKEHSKRRITNEWLAQTLASIFWISSVFSYGISSTGDWLQLFAASAWLIANVASFSKP